MIVKVVFQCFQRQAAYYFPKQSIILSDTFAIESSNTGLNLSDFH